MPNPSNTARRLSIEERVLLALARDPNEREVGSTANYTLENCLDFPLKTVPDLVERVRGKRVLDFGCGRGWQAVALRNLGAGEIWGVDIIPDSLTFARDLAARSNADVHFAAEVPNAMAGTFNVVLSISAFEHFADPVSITKEMRRMTAPGGSVIITWAEPWYSHSGSHIGNFTRIPGTNASVPWCNLFFSEKALLTLRAQFRPEHPDHLEAIPGGLNRMTIARFERIMRSSGMQIEILKTHATLGLPLVSKIPLIRELLSSAATCILRQQ